MSSLVHVEDSEEDKDNYNEYLSHSKESSEESNTNNHISSLQESPTKREKRKRRGDSPAMRKVRILPGKLLDRSHSPVEPPEEPPVPNSLVSLLIVGDADVGKTSLVKSFVHHEAVVSSKSNKTENEKEGIIRQPKANRRIWSVEYFRKDIAFANSRHCLKSLRVQILDTSGVTPSIGADNTTTAGGNKMENPSEFNTLLKKATSILLVVSLKESPEYILQNIKTWKNFLDAQMMAAKLPTSKPIILMLHQSDQTLNQSGSVMLHPIFWMEFGKEVSALCRKLNIQSWYTTSSLLEDDVVGNSIDNAFRQILGHHGQPYVPSRAAASRSITNVAALGDDDDDHDRKAEKPQHESDDLENTTTSKTEALSSSAATTTPRPTSRQGKTAAFVSPLT